MRAAILVAIAASLVGCKKDPNADVCEHYAKLAVECREDKTDKDAVVSDIANNFCIKGMSGEHEDIFGPPYRKMIECTRTATTCAQFHTCEEP